MRTKREHNFRGNLQQVSDILVPKKNPSFYNSEHSPSCNGEHSLPYNGENSIPYNGENSPPLEGCPQGGVVNTIPQGEAVNTIPQNLLVSAHPQVKITLTAINNTPIIRNFVENLPYNPRLKQLAKDKRKAGILSEVLFWQQVHKGKFHKIDFDRQRIIGNYIVDFYVKTLGLIIEIDGSSHDNKQEYDAIRQAYLESFGLKMYRILDWDVKQHLTGVMQALENYIKQEFGDATVLV